MKKILIFFLLQCALISSCKKDEPDYINKYIGVYNAMKVGGTYNFPVLVDMVDDNTVIIETEWYGGNKSFKATIDKFNFTIPEQNYDGDRNISGIGSLNDNTIIMEYSLSGSLKSKIIGSK